MAPSLILLEVAGLNHPKERGRLLLSFLLDASAIIFCEGRVNVMPGASNRARRSEEDFDRLLSIDGTEELVDDGFISEIPAILQSELPDIHMRISKAFATGVPFIDEDFPDHLSQLLGIFDLCEPHFQTGMYISESLPPHGWSPSSAAY